MRQITILGTAVFGLTFLGACTPQEVVQAPETDIQTIVSANPCIDAILVELVEHDRILSVSHYSQRHGSSSMDVELARSFASNGGTAEEIIALRPDLALLGFHTPQATLRALDGAGINYTLIAVPNSIEDSLDQIAQIGVAVGDSKKASDLSRLIQNAVNIVEDGTPNERPSLLIWQAGGLVPGAGTLVDDMLYKAGFQNASAQYGLAMWDILPLEPVANDPPDVILSPTNGKSGDRRNVALRTQFLTAFENDVATTDIPENLLHCGGPTILRAMKLLKDIRWKLDRSAGVS